MASSRDNLKVYIRVTQNKSVSENPKSSKKQKTSSAEENIDEQENISRKSTMKQQGTRKRKDISENGNFIYFCSLTEFKLRFMKYSRPNISYPFRKIVNELYLPLS